jgi:hypothetical protein
MPPTKATRVLDSALAKVAASAIVDPRSAQSDVGRSMIRYFFGRRRVPDTVSCVQCKGQPPGTVFGSLRCEWPVGPKDILAVRQLDAAGEPFLRPPQPG